MSKVVALVALSDNAISVAINGGVPRSLYNPNDLLVRPNPAGDGAIVKLSDESWRQSVYLADTVTEGGVTKSPFADLTALVAYLDGFFHN